MKRILFGIAAISACMVQTSGNQSRVEPDTGITASEYDVYTYMLGTVGTAEFKIVADSTLRRARLQRSVCRDPEQVDCVPSSPPIVAAWHDYNEMNEHPRRLEMLFPANLHVTMERDSHPTELTCHSPTTISFSRVGFDPRHSYAVVTMGIRTGKGPYPGCGGLSIMTVVLERQRDKWRRIAYIESLES